MNTFEAGRTYTLKVGSVYDFSFTDDIRSKVGIMPGQYSTFTFTPTRVYPNGNACVDNVCVAIAREFSMFDLVEPTNPDPKIYEPFKVGASYKLRKQYKNDFEHTAFTRKINGGVKGTFIFTVDMISSDGRRAYQKDEADEYHLIAWKRERHMFKRVDNK